MYFTFGYFSQSLFSIVVCLSKKNSILGKLCKGEAHNEIFASLKIVLNVFLVSPVASVPSLICLQQLGGVNNKLIHTWKSGINLE